MEYIERVDTFLEVRALNQTFPSRGLHSLCEMMINRPLTHIWKAWCLPAIYFTSRKKEDFSILCEISMDHFSPQTCRKENFARSRKRW